MIAKIMPEICYNFTATVCLACLLIIPVTHHAKANEDLWDALKQGGKVVLMRHAPVERGAAGGNPLLRDPSCRSERNLSDEGKRNAELLGRRFREHEIPVSKVFHSPFCRTAETANIVFGKSSPAEYLSLTEILGPAEAAKQAQALTRVIGSYADEGNLILVTHEPNIRAIAFERVRHLNFLVLAPEGNGEFDELGVIRFSEAE